MTHLTEEQLLETVQSLSDASAVQKFAPQYWLETCRTNPLGYDGKNLNELCPQVHPVGIKEFLEQWWVKN